MAIGLMLGGGAPTLTLETGALAALNDKGVRFDMISTSGAGMLVGLLYAASRGGDRAAALAETREMGVHDRIYRHFPINYKIFEKPGVLADVYRTMTRPYVDAYKGMLKSLPLPDGGDRSAERFLSDWADLWMALWCPTGLRQSSLGMCAHAPWIEDVVDFTRLKHFPGEFYMNAYCLEDQEMHIFGKHEITPAHFRAALSFPSIYPPYQLNGNTYIEGSALDTLNFRGVLKWHDKRVHNAAKNKGHLKLDKVVVLDVLSQSSLIRLPRDLYDSYVLSIIVPLVEAAKNDLALFLHQDPSRFPEEWKVEPGFAKDLLLRVGFEIPDSQWTEILDWSYSNMSRLYDIGYEAGIRFHAENREDLDKAMNTAGSGKDQGEQPPAMASGQ